MAGFKPALCVSIHDVAPATWPLCEKLIAAVGKVAPIPLTFLVVPAWHHQCKGESDDACFAALDAHREHGNELALHGYTHLDEGRGPDCPWTYFCRHIYTQGEGEFAGLGVRQANRRLAWGIEWFARRGWTPDGFVAPAWLLSDGSWEALASAPFRYTTTFSRFYLLPQRRSLFAPALVYSARSGWGSTVSRCANDLCTPMLQSAPLLRLALHPRDAHYPSTLLHCQRAIEKLLLTRDAMTKSAFALHWSAAQAGDHWDGVRSAASTAS
jgi:predicted deacetylase